MLASQLQAFISTPWAASAGVGNIQYPIPQTSPGVPGRASWALGEPPETMLLVTGGGVAPWGQDYNGVMFTVTAILQAQQAGYFAKYSSTVSSALGGYWSGAVLRSADGHSLWLSTTDNNVTNPDAAGAGWTSLGVRTVFGRTGPAITAQAGDYTAAQVGALPDNTFTALVGVNGYEYNHATGLIDMWGETASIAEDTEVAISFVMSGLPSGFPHACLNIQVTGDYGGHTDSDVIGQFNRSSLTQVGCTLMRDSGGGGGYDGVLHWRAKGW